MEYPADPAHCLVIPSQNFKRCLLPKEIDQISPWYSCFWVFYMTLFSRPPFLGGLSGAQLDQCVQIDKLIRKFGVPDRQIVDIRATP